LQVALVGVPESGVPEVVVPPQLISKTTAGSARSIGEMFIIQRVLDPAP
jgi:hypothetical protein